MRIRSRLTMLFAIVVLAGGLVAARGASAQTVTDQQALVERARLSFDEMIRNPDYPALPDLLRRARAVLIVPELLKGAFFIGGEGGNGVLLVRQPGEAWSYPTFYTMGSGSLGLQFGGQFGQLVMTIMTERALNAVLAGEVTVGANVRAALVTVGMGLGAATALDRNADMYAFWDSRGLFAGAAVEGMVIRERPSWNQAYYGPGVTVQGILVGRHVNAHADPLRMAVAAAAQPGQPGAQAAPPQQPAPGAWAAPEAAPAPTVERETLPPPGPPRTLVE